MAIERYDLFSAREKSDAELVAENIAEDNNLDVEAFKVYVGRYMLSDDYHIQTAVTNFEETYQGTYYSAREWARQNFLTLEPETPSELLSFIDYRAYVNHLERIGAYCFLELPGNGDVAVFVNS